MVPRVMFSRSHLGPAHPQEGEALSSALGSLPSPGSPLPSCRPVSHFLCSPKYRFSIPAGHCLSLSRLQGGAGTLTGGWLVCVHCHRLPCRCPYYPCLGASSLPVLGVLGAPSWGPSLPVGPRGISEAAPALPGGSGDQRPGVGQGVLLWAHSPHVVDKATMGAWSTELQVPGSRARHCHTSVSPGGTPQALG